jgi:hypothetical protein
MILRALRHFGFAVWLGAIALAASGIQQGQLSANVVTAAIDDAAMMAKMGHDMAHHHGAGGHTHKGHADCEVCGVVAALAFVTIPVAALVPAPQLFALAPNTFTAQFTLPATRSAPYASRAPPTLLG